MKNKLATILTSAILVLTTNSLPSYALNESSIASLPKQSKTQTNPKPQSPKRPPDAPPVAYCYKWRKMYHYRLKRWVYVIVNVRCGSNASPSLPNASPSLPNASPSLPNSPLGR